MDSLTLLGEEDLDTSPEEQSIKQLNDTIVDLQNIYDELVTNKGINKTLAVAIESIQSDLLGTQYPINSFTVEMSPTNYQVALESVTLGTAAAIAALVAAIAAFIVKIISWIRNSITRVSDKSRYNETLIKNSAVLAKEIYSLQTRVADKDKQAIIAITNAIAEESGSEFNGIHNDLLKDLVTGSKVRTALLSVGGQFDHYLQQINNKIVIYENAIRIANNNNDSNVEAKVLSTLSAQQEGIKLGNAASHVDAVVGRATPGTLSESLAALNTALADLQDSNSSANFNYNFLFDALRMDKIHLTDLFLQDVSRTEKNLATIEKRLQSLSSKNNQTNASSSVVSMIREAGDIIRSEVLGLQSYIAGCNRVITLNGQFAVLLNQYVNRHYKRVLSDMMRSDSDSTRNAGRDSKRETADQLQ